MAGVQPKGDNSVRQYGGASEKNSTNCRFFRFLFRINLFPNSSQLIPT